MDLEELSKSQIILLAVLVSFITSIATGIVTISLLDSSPAGVSQTVHKVVERTVEKVTPKDEGNMVSAGGVKKETTVVVKEDDMITNSISKNIKSLVRINRIVGAPSSEAVSTSTSASTTASSMKPQTKQETEFAGIGVVVSKDGLIAAPRLAQNEYEAEFYNGRSLSIAYTGVANENLIFLKVDPSKLKNTSLKPVEFADMDNLALGRTVIAISGVRRNNVSIGIVSALPEEEVVVERESESPSDSKEKTVSRISSVVTDIDSNEVLSGSPLITLFNKMAGIATPSGLKGEDVDYVPAYEVEELLDKYRSEQSKKQEE